MLAHNFSEILLNSSGPYLISVNDGSQLSYESIRHDDIIYQLESISPHYLLYAFVDCISGSDNFATFLLAGLAKVFAEYGFPEDALTSEPLLFNAEPRFIHILSGCMYNLLQEFAINNNIPVHLFPYHALDHFRSATWNLWLSSVTEQRVSDSILDRAMSLSKGKTNISITSGLGPIQHAAIKRAYRRALAGSIVDGKKGTVPRTVADWEPIHRVMKTIGNNNWRLFVCLQLSTEEIEGESKAVVMAIRRFYQNNDRIMIKPKFSPLVFCRISPISTLTGLLYELNEYRPIVVCPLSLLGEWAGSTQPILNIFRDIDRYCEIIHRHDFGDVDEWVYAMKIGAENKGVCRSVTMQFGGNLRMLISTTMGRGVPLTYVSVLSWRHLGGIVVASRDDPLLLHEHRWLSSLDEFRVSRETRRAIANYGYLLSEYGG